MVSSSCQPLSTIACHLLSRLHHTSFTGYDTELGRQDLIFFTSDMTLSLEMDTSAVFDASSMSYGKGSTSVIKSDENVANFGTHSRTWRRVRLVDAALPQETWLASRASTSQDTRPERTPTLAITLM